MSDPLATLSSALADRYTIERELGRGGMATVYLARDVRQDRRVAIKVLHPDFTVALGAERFQREIAIASSLTHPHIVPLYESGEAGGSLYYVMPYVEGETLRARLDREKQLSLEDAIRIACEIASALDYAHRHGVVHRDVKPANILLEDGHAVIADFGVARALSRATGEHTLTVTGVTLGTPSYMSPEQASAEREIDGRSDIYALGCVVYEMLAGQPPFTGPNPQAVMARHAMDTAPSIRVVRNIVPPEVEAAVFCAMAKSPADRFTTAQQFADALTGTGGMGTTLRYTAKWAIARKRRHRMWMVAIATGLILPLGGFGAWLTFGPPVSEASIEVAGFPQSRIAVLYFEDQSHGTLAHVADGLTEALITELDRVDGLDVVSARGVEPFRGTADVRQVGAALQAGTIVTGALRSIGDRVHVSVRMYEGHSAIEYDRRAFEEQMIAIPAARDSLVEQVAAVLRTRLREEVALRRDRRDASHPDAWLLVQRARWQRRQADSAYRAGDADGAREMLSRADSLLGVARALDAKWTGPLVARAALSMQRIAMEAQQPRIGELIELGLALADTALRMNDKDFDALELRGTLRFHKMARGLEPNPARAADLLRLAEADLLAAVRLNNQQAGALATLSLLYYRQYDRVNAAIFAQRAYEADAYLSSAREILWRLYATQYDLEQFHRAASWCAEGRRRFPADFRFARCAVWLHTTDVMRADVEEAWRAAALLDSLAPPALREYLRREGQIAVAAAIGRAARAPGADSAATLDSARNVLVRARADRRIDPDGELMGYEAAVRVMLGEHDEAIHILQRYLTLNPIHREGFVKSNSWWWKPLRSDPRFMALTGSTH